MPVLHTKSHAGPKFERNAAAYAEVLSQLRDRHRQILRGGGEKLRARHIERGKIPVR